MKQILALLVLAVAPNVADAQWFQQNSGTTAWLNSVSFANANTGWAVGETTILSTTDGGTSWMTQSSTTTSNLWDVFFIDVNTGWAVGDSGTIHHTTNGGATWANQLSETTSDLRDVFFIDVNTGWVAGLGASLRTTNGGTTWTSQSPIFPRRFFFIDFNLGWGVSGGMSGTVVHTTNGGTSWTQQWGGPHYPYLEDIFFIDASNGWTVGYGIVLHTTDGGSSWTTQRSEQEYLTGVSFTDVNTGTAVGDNGVVLRTTDGGANWTSQPSGTVNQLTDVSFTDANTGWAVGGYGAILHTTNGGATFVEDQPKDVPNAFSLAQNYPNPFNPTSTITYDLPTSSHVTLKVYDVLGREVATLVDGEESAGTKSVSLNADNMASGVYLYRLQAGKFSQLRKMLLV